MKRILLLGGSAQQIVAIETAKRLGYYTILCDYLSNNPGQYHADKFYLISTTDKEAVLEIARTEMIDGVLAYASDPAAPTAAYVAEKLGLKTNPYKSVEILCNKDKFREFLRNNGFNAPNSEGYSSKESAINEIEKYSLPVIIKPVDSSGSKGTTVLRDLEGLDDALDFAFSFSRSNRIIIEEFLEKKHPYLIGGDIFVEDGKVVLWGLLNCHRDSRVNSLVPVGKSYPLEIEDNDVNRIKDTLQSIVDKLEIKDGAMNVELIIDKDNKVWPIDIGPRNGGNMIPDLLGMIFDVDIVEMTVKAAMGPIAKCNIGKGDSFFATHNLHSDKDGVLENIRFSEEIEKYIIRKEIYVKENDEIEYFDNASKALGVIFMKFNSHEEMQTILNDIHRHIDICLKK